MSTDSDNSLVVHHIDKKLERHLNIFTIGECKIIENIYVLAWFKHMIIYASKKIAHGTLWTDVLFLFIYLLK